MAFFGLMRVKRHVEAIAHERYFIACRDETIVTRNATIERLQRENARLLGEVSGLRSDVSAAEMAYEESHKAHKRLAAELATFRQQQEQRRANLAKGTVASAAKRAAKARERAESVG